MREKNIAIVLAAGSGSRMQRDVRKQYLYIEEKPVLYYSLRAFERHALIDELCLVLPKADIAWVEQEWLKRWGLRKPCFAVAGGRERYHSVALALEAIEARFAAAAYRPGLIFVHDSARPLVSEALISAAARGAERYGAAVPAVALKDTIKRVDEAGFVAASLDRSSLRCMQTPQTFRYELLREAYARLAAAERAGESLPPITDDAMVAEYFLKAPVYLSEGDYRNIKLTTPEDLQLAELYLRERTVPTE